MNEREQRELENYLREFHPRASKALPLAERPQNWRRLAAAIAIFLLGAASIWSAWRHTDRKAAVAKKVAEETPVAASTIPLTRLALENPSEFETRLDTQALKTLQKFDRTDSALRALAKE
jgi:hypothetical protein